ncbi:MAG: hypothetical protein AB1599_10915 [Planctomycetota bacterium]
MSRRRDYIPRKDSDFDGWFRNFYDRINANPAVYGVSPSDLADLQAAYAAWQADYPRHITDQATARASAEKKDASRKTSESVSRRLGKLIQSREETTDAQREELAIPVYDLIRTRLSEQVVLDTQPPVIQAKCTAPKTVRIDWYPSQVEGQSGALPKGISWVAIWVAPVEADMKIPTDRKKWRYLTYGTKSPYVHEVKNAATVTLAYKAQWCDSKGRMGPFGQPVICAVTP